MAKKAAGRGVTTAKRGRGKGTLLAAVLALSLASAGAALALWGPKQSAAPGRLAALPASAVVAPAAPQSQNTFSPSSPAKEYVYAGGRLVATEEPTPAAALGQAITFAQPPDKTYGDPPFALSATSSSGLPVSLAVTSGPATLSGNTLTITGAGVVSVRAEQAGVPGYNPAEPVARSFTVTKAVAQVTLSNLTGRVYDGTPKPVTVQTSPAGLSGVAVTYNGSATAPTGAGSYNVTATLTNANYAAPSASATLVISKATPAITWSNPADIAEGTPLSPAQLNAMANVPGSFAYSPPAGTVLSPGDNHQLSAVFTPADAANYNTAATSARINVVACPRAQISYFGSPHDVIGEGASTTLNWNVPYARNVSIGGVSGVFAAAGQTTVTPPSTTTYTLTAGAGPCPAISLQKTITVVPCPKEATTTFNADSYLLVTGDSVHLNWSSPNASGVTISAQVACPPGLLPGHYCQDGRSTFFGSQDSGGGITLTPATTTTYILTVGSAYGCPLVEKRLTVEVVPDPSDCSPGAFFGVGSMPPGQDFFEGTVRLTWSVPNASGVTITDDTGAALGTVGTSGSIFVSNMFSTRTYTLSAQIARSASCSPYVMVTTVECFWDCDGATSTY